MPTFGAGIYTATAVPPQSGTQRAAAAATEFSQGATALLVSSYQDYTGLTVRSFRKMPNGTWASEPQHYENFTSFGSLNATHPVLEVKDANGTKVWPVAPGTTPQPAPREVPPPSTPSSPPIPNQGPYIGETIIVPPVPPGYRFPEPHGNPFLTNDDGKTWLFYPVNPPNLAPIEPQKVYEVLPFKDGKVPEAIDNWVKYWCKAESINVLNGFIDHFRAIIQSAPMTKWKLEHELASSAYIDQMETLAGFATNGYLALIILGLRGYRPPEMEYVAPVSIKLLADMVELAKTARQEALTEGTDASWVDYFPNMLRRLAEACEKVMKSVTYAVGKFADLVEKYPETVQNTWKWIAIGLAAVAVITGVTAAAIYIPRPRR